MTINTNPSLTLDITVITVCLVLNFEYYVISHIPIPIFISTSIITNIYIFILTSTFTFTLGQDRMSSPAICGGHIRVCFTPLFPNE